jgi:hypothetical protein
VANATASLAKQVEQFLLLSGGEGFLLGQEMLIDEYLHLPLAGENFLLLGCDCLAIGLGGGNQVQEFVALAVDLLANGLGAAAKLRHSRFELMPLRGADIELSMKWAPDAFSGVLTAAIQTGAACPDAGCAPDAEKAQV